MGLMAALVLPSAAEGVAAFNLCATDYWSRPSFPTTLIFNGGVGGEVVLTLPTSGDRFDLYDAVSQKVVAAGAPPPSVAISLPPGEAAVLVAIPSGTELVRDDAHNWLMAAGRVVDWQLVPR